MKNTVKHFELGFYTVPKPGLMERQLEILAAAGVKYCGTDGFCSWCDSVFTAQIARIIKGSGLPLYSFHAPFGLCFPNSRDRQRTLDDNRRILDVAAEWGAKSTVWHFRWFRAYDGDTHFADTKVMDGMPAYSIDVLMAEVLPETCAYAARNGIGINLENLPLFSWGRDCGAVFDFIRRQQLDNLGFIYDIGHAHCSGYDIATVIREAGTLLRDTHFHDNRGTGQPVVGREVDCGDIPGIDLHLPVGLGTIDWVEVIRALREINYTLPVTFEGPHLKGHPEVNSPEQYRRCVRLTVDNWRALEELAVYLP